MKKHLNKLRNTDMKSESQNSVGQGPEGRAGPQRPASPSPTARSAWPRRSHSLVHSPPGRADRRRQRPWVSSEERARSSALPPRAVSRVKALARPRSMLQDHARVSEDVGVSPPMGGRQTDGRQTGRRGRDREVHRCVWCLGLGSVFHPFLTDCIFVLGFCNKENQRYCEQ